MMKRTIAFMLTLSVLPLFAGCAEESHISSSSAAVSSSFAVSVPASAAVSSVPEEQVRLASLPLLGSDGEEQVYVLEGDRKDNIWSSRYYWVNEDRLLLFRKEESDGERQPLLFDFKTNTVHTVDDAPVELSYSNEYYMDKNGIHIFMEDGVLRHYDHALNLIKETAFSENRDRFDRALDFQNEILYYLDETGLYREHQGEVKLLAEFPEPSGHSFAHALQLSNDKKHLIFRAAVYEAQNADSLLDYHLETGELTEMPGVFDPQIDWVDGQPFIYTYSEDEKQFVFSFRHGYEQAEVMEYAAYKNAPYEESIGMSSTQHGICIEYTRRYEKEPTMCRIACIREDGSYFVYSGEHDRNDMLCYPSLSPDQNYLSFVIAEEECFTLRLVPTENLWQPLDWEALERELFQN